MAIVRTAGTEIIRCHHFQDINSTEGNLIIGEEDHIYTVLSIICYMRVTSSDPDWVNLFLTGFDSYGGATAQKMSIFVQNMNAEETFVWNDKFSFNGFEPDASAMSGVLSTSAEQNAIADQGSAVAQVLTIECENAANKLDVHITFIDQNNA